jgi:hypothetical protein
MDTGIEIIEKELGDVAEIEENIYVWQMPSVMSKNFEILAKYADIKCDAESGLSPYARYVGFDWEKELSKGMIANIADMFIKRWHFFTGVQTPLKPGSNGTIRSNRIGKRRYVKALHYGPYHKVGSTYQKMFDWSKERNIVLGNESIEFYLNDPSETEKEKIETMVLIPVVGER